LDRHVLLNITRRTKLHITFQICINARSKPLWVSLWNQSIMWRKNNSNVTDTGQLCLKWFMLARLKPSFTTCTTTFSAQKLYILPTQFIRVFCKILIESNKNYFHSQQGFW